MVPDFALDHSGVYSDLFKTLGIKNFSEACNYVARLPYGRNSDRNNFLTVLSERKGTCSSKHALLAELAIEQVSDTVELICGIFLMSPETHDQLTPLFIHYGLTAIPEAHCYLRIAGSRYDFTSESSDIELISSKIVREQRIDPQQVSDWKPMIHKHFIGGWLRRNPEIPYSEEELWRIREEMIEAL